MASQKWPPVSSGGGSSLPTGGGANQLLKKNSATDGDVEWSGSGATLSDTGTLTLGGNMTASGQANGGTNPIGSSGTSKAIDWNQGNLQTITLTGNCTLTFSNPKAGGAYLLVITQDATGSRTLSWPTIKWQGGSAPTLTGTAASIDIVSLIYDGTTYYGNIVKGLS